MKKLLHILFPVLLSMLFVFMASGVTFRHCACSGKTSITIGDLSRDKGNTQSSDGCMTIATVSLSPTTQAQPTTFDFHVFQPLVAIINTWDAFNLAPRQVETNRRLLPERKDDPPPRQYLHKLCVLTI